MKQTLNYQIPKPESADQFTIESLHGVLDKIDSVTKTAEDSKNSVVAKDSQYTVNEDARVANESTRVTNETSRKTEFDSWREKIVNGVKLKKISSTAVATVNGQAVFNFPDIIFDPVLDVIDSLHKNSIFVSTDNYTITPATTSGGIVTTPVQITLNSVVATDVIVGTELEVTIYKNVAYAENETIPIERVISAETRLDNIDSSLADIAKFKTYKEKQTYLYDKFFRKLKISKSATIDCMGDSYTYGYDTMSPADQLRPADPTPCPDGSVHGETRALISYPEQLQTCLRTVYGNGINVINRGYSGDNAIDAYSRWITTSGADLTTINFGTNDARELTIDNMKTSFEYYRKLIERELDWGAAVIILTPPKQKQSADTTIDIYSDALFSLGQEYNIPVIETDVFTENYSDVHSDDVHFNTKGYTVYGSRLAAIFVGEGANKPKHVGNGTVLLTRRTIDNLTLISGTAFPNSNTYPTPAEITAGTGIGCNLSTDGSIIYSIFVDRENTIVLPTVSFPYSDSIAELSLDFGIASPDYSTDFVFTPEVVDFSKTPKNPVNFTINDAALYSSLWFTPNDLDSFNKPYLFIATPGWHTIKVTAKTHDVRIMALEFFDYQLLAERVNRLSASGYYWRDSISVTTAVTQTKININSLAKALNITSLSGWLFAVPLKITVYNYSQSILQYVFMFSDITNWVNGWEFISTPTRTNIAASPTDERTITSITVDSATGEYVITWGGNTSRKCSFEIQML